MKKVVRELVEVTKKHVAERVAARGQVGTIRADVKHREQKTFEAVIKSGDKEFTFLFDEPAERGGLGLGAHPLGYFLAAAGA